MFSTVVLSSLAILAKASPINTTKSTVDIAWTGTIPGHGEVSLYGNANSVEDQILAIKPSLKDNLVVMNPFMSKAPQAFNETSMTVSNFSYMDKTPTDGNIVAGMQPALAARTYPIDNSQNLDDGYTETHWNCGNFATGDYNEGFGAIAAVNAPGGVTGGYWTVPGAEGDGTATCRRLGCSRASYTHTAVYWCNDQPFDVTAPANVLAALAGMIAMGYNEFGWHGCCLTSQTRGTNHQYSGQVFPGNGTNIVVGWGDCSNDDYDVLPSTYALPGPYGVCI
ncbi:hypothetical protein M406DRAFT_67466 [Cryphonectria parasitica EP155]|uniref:Uncharacterized protein n=1 Tax=Cryphonectria parasitica (strain ATCC 38755 / EP155) TaxID=660469 RepID=A0A9P4YD20_CRYP1|nr:uncharacterized protein M406DRAFT_67466 [Cryphonectria parasitica EP155]KAF3771136.1 hypothetical protein M406DRAFT_67466 [Cryphonectria parasitica EP155]